jgi:hypothetical protein
MINLNNKSYKLIFDKNTIIRINFKISMIGYNFKIFKSIKGDIYNEPEEYVCEGEAASKGNIIFLNYSKPYVEFLNFYKLNFQNDKLYWNDKEFIKI